ncbi:MAG: response regulator [Schleiferiaceae bacterium]|nr:response regulator [Schleiferiaceae bacterium]
MGTLQRTMLVEDDKITTIIVSRMVSSHSDYEEVSTFENGQLAFDYIKSIATDPTQYPEVILLDINMPVMDGWEFLDGVSAISGVSEIPVAVLTSSIDPEDIEKSQTYKQVLGYYTKPLNDNDLSEIAAKVKA